MFERVQSDIVGLRGEVKSLEASVDELKRSTVARLDQSEAQISDLGTLAKAATMICFRCHGYVVEYIQLQCGHLFCLHCFGCKDLKILVQVIRRSTKVKLFHFFVTAVTFRLSFCLV